MKKTLNIIIILLLVSVPSFAAAIVSDTTKIKIIPSDASKPVLEEINNLPKGLKEASGLEHSSHHFWSHNDNGVPALYRLDSAGRLVGTLHVNCINRGWEDVAQDEQHNFYIGGFGNNDNNKKDLKIYKISDPENSHGPVVTPEIIQYNYSDQKSFPPDVSNRNFDVDAFFAMKSSLYLFTKNRSAPFNGFSKVYRLSTDPGEHVAQLTDSIYVGKGAMMNNWVTGADISPDGKTVALLLHDRILFIRNFKENHFSSGSFWQLNLNTYTHKAGICFTDNHTLYIVDELELGMIGGKLYKLDLSPYLKYLKP